MRRALGELVYKRRTYSILSIAYRHPMLFAMMMKINRINTPVIYAESQNEMNRVF